MGVWWWVTALALHHQATESLPVEPHPCSHLCQGSLCLPNLAAGKSNLLVPTFIFVFCLVIVVNMVVAQHCQLLILGFVIAQVCCLTSQLHVCHRHACQEQAQIVRIDSITRNSLQSFSFANTACLTISI
jgi:hypothetical protein